jgi:hypothetical protein
MKYPYFHDDTPFPPSCTTGKTEKWKITVKIASSSTKIRNMTVSQSGAIRSWEGNHGKAISPSPDPQDLAPSTKPHVLIRRWVEI